MVVILGSEQKFLQTTNLINLGFLGEVQFLKISQKVDFSKKKWGSIREKPQKQDFSHYPRIQEWGCIGADTVASIPDHVLLRLIILLFTYSS